MSPSTRIVINKDTRSIRNKELVKYKLNQTIETIEQHLESSRRLCRYIQPLLELRAMRKKHGQPIPSFTFPITIIENGQCYPGRMIP